MTALEKIGWVLLFLITYFIANKSRLLRFGTFVVTRLLNSQKAVARVENNHTHQEHMALMLRGWAGIEKASSHSGRRALITDVIHKQKKSVKVAQKIAGHVNPSTTIIYEEPPEEEISEALKNVSE